MPELPEVETIRRGLVPLIGTTIESVEIRRSDVINGLIGSRHSHQKGLLAGTAIVGLHRHGKQLAIEGKLGRVVLVQLGMSGQLLVEQIGAAMTAHSHVVWNLADGRRLTFRDPRRFGGITLHDSLKSLREAWANLGPDALEITEAQLRKACTGTRRSIKAVLLDQNAIAGVGNIYADESLFRSGVRPTRRAHRLNERQFLQLADAIREVLNAGVEGGGSTLRDYVGVDGRSGSAQESHRVYGRGGLPCVQCGGALRKTVVTQRTTVYCPGCQP